MSQGPPPPSRRAPRNEEEFLRLMEDVDAALVAEEVPIPARELKAGQLVSRWLSQGLKMGPLPKREPVPGVYDGDDFVLRMRDWFRSRYGDRLNVSFSPGRTITQIRGDIWELRLPWIVGQVTLTNDPSVNSSPSGFRRADSGVQVTVNVLDSVRGLSPTLRSSLSTHEAGVVYYDFTKAMEFFDLTNPIKQRPFIAEALADVDAAVHHLLQNPRDLGHSRWVSLQATEKFLKSWLTEARISFKRNHQLMELGQSVANAGALLPLNVLPKIQCDASVRYGEAPSTKIQAVAAHRGTLLFGGYLLKQWPPAGS